MAAGELHLQEVRARRRGRLRRMGNKKINPYSFKDDEREFCPYDGEACPRRGRCFRSVTGVEYDYSTEMLSLEISLCPRAHCQDFEKLLNVLLFRRIGALDDIRRKMWELRRRDMR